MWSRPAEEGRRSHIAGLLDAIVHRHEAVASFGAIIEFPAKHMAPQIKRKSDVTLRLEAMSPVDALAEIQRLAGSGKMEHAVRLLQAVGLRKAALILASPSTALKVF